MSEVELLERTLRENNRRSTQGEYFDAPDFTRVTDPDAKTDYRNLVLRSVFTEDEADERIEETKTHFRTIGVDFRWWITPSTRPLDFADRLEHRGLRLADKVVGMVANPDSFSIGSSPQIEVRRVEAADLDLYADLCSQGWGAPPDARQRFRRIAEIELASGGERATYIARYRGEPAATAGLSFFEASAHFGGSVVLPRFRGRGIYRALIEERMRIVRQRNVPIVTNLCRASTSASICRKVGFRSICEMLVFSSATRESSRHP